MGLKTLGSILGSSFVKFWDKIGYSILSSLIAALNPLFLLLNLSWLQLLKDKTGPALTTPETFIIFFAVAALTQSVFPTALVCIQTQKELSEGDIVYVKNYFQDLWPALKKHLRTSLVLTVLFGAAGFLMGTASVYYYRTIASPSLRIAFLLFLLFSFLALILIQFVLVPVFMYRDNPGFLKSFRFAASAVLLNLPLVAGVVLADTLLFTLLLFANGASFFLYYGISGYFRIYLFSHLSSKYPRFPWKTPPAEQPPETQEQ